MFRAFLTVFALFLTGFAAAETRVPTSQAEISLGFAPLVKETAPAVVNIYAKRVVETRSSPFRGDPFFENLFRDFAQPRPRVQNSLGSGVILSEDGIIVSNYHVVGMATDIRVHLADRREFVADVLLGDRESDLAVLQLREASDMPYLTLRNSDTVEVGELVLAIGNPFGVGQTVSSGIVSGLARSGTATGQAFGYFLQTDAPINPGNSGGALVDINGELIGVNTSILTRSGGSNGIGFAIPSSLVARFVEQARAGNTTFQRPWAGMSGQLVDADLAESLGLQRPGGLLISQLHPQSPFFAQGFEPGDVILEVDGLPVNSAAEMVFRMTVAGLGETALIGAVMGGEAREVLVELSPAPETPPRNTVETSKRSVMPGLVVSNANPAVVTEYDLAYDVDGVVVENPGKIGARLGLARGDVILRIDRNPVADTSEVEDLLRDISGRATIEILRGSRRMVIRFRV